MGDSPVGQVFKKKKILSTLTDFADPLHLDPVGRWLHTQAANAVEDKDKPPEYAPPPTPEDPIKQGAFAGIQSTKERQTSISRASTLLNEGGGGGLLEEPNTYSASRSLFAN